MHPVKRLESKIRNLAAWLEKYPTRADHTAPKSIISFNTNHSGHIGLPFNAEAWFDEPVLGAQGAKTKTEILDLLSSWVRAWSDQLPPGNLWASLQHLPRLLADEDEDAFYDFEQDINTLHSRVRRVVAPREPAQPCLTCGAAMEKIMTLSGWEGGLYCRDCQRITSQEAWVKDYLEFLQSSDAWLSVDMIKQLFPGVKACTLRKWVQRGKLESRKNSAGVRLYQPCAVSVLFSEKSAAA